MGGKSSSSNSTSSAAYDNRVVNDYEIDASSRTDLGDGAIVTSGDVTVTSVDGDIVENAFNFAEQIAGDSLKTSSDALSQAFNSTAGGVIQAGRDFIKYGGLGIGAVILILAFMNRNK